MPLLPIRKYGDPVLRQVAEPVSRVTDELRQLAADMGETMYEANGIGLAANQVGDLRRILVIDVADVGERAGGEARQRGPARQLEVFINPVVLWESPEDDDYNEGCLSMPGIEGDVYRPIAIRLRWMDLEGAEHEEEADGIRARVLLHEIDHLDGKLFTDRLGLLARQRVAGKLRRLREQTEEEMGLAPGVGR